MTRVKARMAAFSVLALACVPPGMDDGGDEVGDTATTGDPCDAWEFLDGPGGAVWLRGPDWEAYAMTIDPDIVQQGLDMGLWTRADPPFDGGDCYEFAPSQHFCVVTVECGTLGGLPIDELEDVIGTCALDGGWEGTVFTDGGQCWGTWGDIAVQIEIDPLN